MDQHHSDPSQSLILIADDDPALTSLIREILADEGYDTTCCYSGAAALHAIQQDMPDLAILDLQMEHDTAGLEVVRKLRGCDEQRHLPVILCSASGPKLAALHGTLQQLGCVSLPKPFNIDQMLGTVEALLRQRGAGRSNSDATWQEREVGR